MSALFSEKQEIAMLNLSVWIPCAIVLVAFFGVLGMCVELSQ